MKDRVFTLEGVLNFRDFGAYEGAGGRHVKAKTLFRSGQINSASEADKAQLDGLNIVLHADLRRPDERRNAAHNWQGAQAVIIASDQGDVDGKAPHLEFLSKIKAGPAEAAGFMLDYYRTAPFTPQIIETYRGWFDGLKSLDEDGAGLINCAAGKDRTGILCALTHHALGVEREAIFADYELTNEAGRLEEILPGLASSINAYLGTDYPDEVFRPILGVDPAYLEAAFDNFSEKSGGLDGYLTDILGVTDSDKANLQAKFLY